MIFIDVQRIELMCLKQLLLDDVYLWFAITTLELRLTTSELWFGQEQEGILT